MWRDNRLPRNRVRRKKRIWRGALFRSSSAREEPMMIFRLLPSSLSLVVVDDVDLMMRMAMDLMLFECERLLWRWVRSSFRPRDDRLGHHLVGMMMIRCCLPLYWPRGIMISREEMMFVCLCFVVFQPALRCVSKKRVRRRGDQRSSLF